MAAEILDSAFEHIPEKHKYDALDDLYILTNDQDESVVRKAICALGSVFEFIPEESKSVAWYKLHILINNMHWDIRRTAISALGSAFEFIPEKYKPDAWEDLHKLIQDNYLLVSDVDLFIREEAVDSFNKIFRYIPNEFKTIAWFDLHKLTIDWAPRRRWNVNSTGMVPLRCQLISSILYNSIKGIGRNFKYIPNDFKSEAWSDLHRLTSDEDVYVRRKVAEAIGSAFAYVSDKSTAWEDLHRLTSDEDSSVIMYANHSLGKICIYNASKSKNDDEARTLLEDAINYFEKATKETNIAISAEFCYSFYCLFDAILFKKVNSKEEIKNHIKTVRIKCGCSENKYKLVESIEQLAGILEMAHNAKELGIEYQELLKYCLDIFNRVEQLMYESKDNNPALYGLYRIAKPSFDKTITELIDKVKETATIAYEEARGTPAETIACSINKQIQGWIVSDQNLMEIGLNLIIDSLKSQIPEIPANKGILDQIDQIKSHTEVEYQMLILAAVVARLPTISFAAKTYETVTRTENKVDSILQTVTELKDLSSKLKEEGNEKGSQDVNDIADKIKVLLENKDSKEISLFIGKIQEEVPSLFEEIEKSTAPKDVKEKAKLGLKDTLMKIGKDISTGVATNWIASYLPSIVGAGASGLLVPGIILAALLSIESMRDKK